MGGQSLARHGTAFTFNTPVCEPDRAAGIYRVGAGTRWRDVIAALDPLGFSPKVMQSNNDFGVASTFSVNAHGWPVPYGPFGSTVRALRLMLEDGSVVQCSRTENVELFRHAMGGYGLFGIILDLDVEMAPNVRLQPTFEPIRAMLSAPASRPPASSPASGWPMDASTWRATGSCRAHADHLRPVTAAGKLPPADAGGGVVSFLSREVYRSEVARTGPSNSAGSWRQGSAACGWASRAATRNTLLNESRCRSPKANDQAHRHPSRIFVPPERFPDFLSACRDVILRRSSDLLNVTLRYLATDQKASWPTRRQPRISAVMSFSQARTPSRRRTCNG